MVIPPSIDPYSPKNLDLAPDVVAAVLARVGLVDGQDPGGHLRFERRQGPPDPFGPIARPAGSSSTVRRPRGGAAVVVQVSRWDRLKDMTGVLSGFARMALEDPPATPT